MIPNVFRKITVTHTVKKGFLLKLKISIFPKGEVSKSKTKRD